eukprot:1160436-Lingulodinium_polyedra.AAC.1
MARRGASRRDTNNSGLAWPGTAWYEGRAVRQRAVQRGMVRYNVVRRGGMAWSVPIPDGIASH